MLRAPSLVIMPSETNRIVSWMDGIESGWSPGGVKYRAAHAADNSWKGEKKENSTIEKGGVQVTAEESE